MNIAGSVSVLTEKEITQIHNAMLSILSEVGVIIEDPTILQRLADHGAIVHMNDMKAFFTPTWVECFIAESDKFNWSTVKPMVTASANIYQGVFLDPETNEFLPWTEKRMADYVKLTHHLEHVEYNAMLGCPLPEINKKLIPLIQRQICWRHGMRPGGSIWDIRFAPYLLQMCEIMAEVNHSNVKDFFTGMVFFTSALKLAKNEAEQFVFFAEKGFLVKICSMTSAGGSAPITLAGAVTMHLAEVMIAQFIYRAFYGNKNLELVSTIAPYDMRTLMFAYGRPERQIMNIMMADIAKRYQVPCHGHGGHTDAKKPSPEVGYQRALTTIPTLMACGITYIGAGKLSMDEVGSPIQMILDNEFIGALKRFANGCIINSDTIALDVIKETGPDGIFLGHPHTAEHFRTELWEPTIWTREMFEGWKINDGRTDIEKAYELYKDIMNRPDLPPSITEETDRYLQQVIDKAEKVF
ncbi:MAG: trimethylamine methyltransferase family protein [bacterium]